MPRGSTRRDEGDDAGDDEAGAVTGVGGVAVIGVGCRFPGGADGPERFWKLLEGGGDAMVRVPAERWAVLYDLVPTAPGRSRPLRGGFLDDIAGWDARLFEVSPDEARRIDPQHRLIMEVAWRAAEDAGLERSAFAARRTGVFVGISDSQQFPRLQHQIDPGCVDDPFMAVGSSTSMAAGRLTHFFDTSGPALTVDTACSTSLVALHLAIESLGRGECELAIVAAASAIVHPETFAAAQDLGMLAPDGRCKTFDRSADGFTVGEGAGAVVLERAADAVAHRHRIRAVARGSAVNQGGRTGGLTAPNRRAQADVIRQALRRGDVAPGDVAFVEGHGTGTVLGDAIELEALAEVFGPRQDDRPLHVGAVKSNVGHLLAAAGMAGFIKTVLALGHRRVPPNIHYSRPNPILRRTPWLRPVDGAVPLGAAEARPLAGVSSFGWSGTNAHVVLEAAALGAAADQVAALPPRPFERVRHWPGPLTTRSPQPPQDRPARPESSKPPERSETAASAEAPEPPEPPEPFESPDIAAADRRARPDLRTPYVPPRTPLQERVAEIWRRCLGIAEVGIDDPFFELGGRSVTAISITRRLERELGTDLSPALVFERPTIRELATALEPTTPAPPGEPDARSEGEAAHGRDPAAPAGGPDAAGRPDRGLRRRRSIAVQARRRPPEVLPETVKEAKR